MVARFRFALVASAVLALAAGLPVLGQAQAQDQGDRGQPAAAVSGGGVTVMKGNPPPKAAPTENATPAAPAAQPGDTIMMGSGGRHMWMVDRANGQITDCQSHETPTPGRPAIDCATRPLPVPSQ